MIKENITPGAVVLIAKDNIIVKLAAFGQAQKFDMGKVLEKPREMSKNTIFDLASVTKVMATTQGIMKLVSYYLLEFVLFNFFFYLGTWKK